MSRKPKSRAQWLLLTALLIPAAPGRAQKPTSPSKLIAPGVWFMTGDTNGYSNTAVIEMRDYLIVVDADYPGSAKELPGMRARVGR